MAPFADKKPLLLKRVQDSTNFFSEQWTTTSEARNRLRTRGMGFREMIGSGALARKTAREQTARERSQPVLFCPCGWTIRDAGQWFRSRSRQRRPANLRGLCSPGRDALHGCSRGRSDGKAKSDFDCFSSERWRRPFLRRPSTGCSRKSQTIGPSAGRIVEHQSMQAAWNRAAVHGGTRCARACAGEQSSCCHDSSAPRCMDEPSDREPPFAVIGVRAGAPLHGACQGKGNSSPRGD